MTANHWLVSVAVGPRLGPSELFISSNVLVLLFHYIHYPHLYILYPDCCYCQHASSFVF